MQPACQHLQPWQSQVSQVMSKPEVCKRPSGFQSELLLCMRVDLGETSLSSDASQLYAQPTDSEHQTSGCLMPMTQPGLISATCSKHGVALLEAANGLVQHGFGT